MTNFYRSSDERANARGAEASPDIRRHRRIARICSCGCNTKSTGVAFPTLPNFVSSMEGRRSRCDQTFWRG